MQTLAERHLQLLIVWLQQLLVDSPKIRLPSLLANSAQHRREVISAAIDDLIILAQAIYLVFRHLAELFEKLGMNLISGLIDKLS